MKIYYDNDADINIIQGINVTIIGYGSQGHAHANNLNDSGVNVTVGLREGSSSWSKAEAAGLNVKTVSESVKDADLVMILAPDEFQKSIFDKHISPNLKSDAILGFAHGFNIHFKKIVPSEDNSVIMIAPKGPGHTVRSTYKNGGGVPSLIAIYKDNLVDKKFNANLDYSKINESEKNNVKDFIKNIFTKPNFSKILSK